MKKKRSRVQARRIVNLCERDPRSPQTDCSLNGREGSLENSKPFPPRLLRRSEFDVTDWILSQNILRVDRERYVRLNLSSFFRCFEILIPHSAIMRHVGVWRLFWRLVVSIRKLRLRLHRDHRVSTIPFERERKTLIQLRARDENSQEPNKKQTMRVRDLRGEGREGNFGRR